MYTLFVECIGGIAGDMMVSALLDAGAELSFIQNQLKKALDDQIEMKIESVNVNGIQSTSVSMLIDHKPIEDTKHLVLHHRAFHSHEHDEHDEHDHDHDHDHHHHEHHHHEHHHRSHSEIITLLTNADLHPLVRKKALAIYKTLAGAEASIHGQTLQEVVFHEVGGLDAIADIVAVSAGLVSLQISKIQVANIPLGSGFVICAHGKTPVPAPATLALMKNFSTTLGCENGEMVTPTGAAILAAFAENTKQPSLKIRAIGYGAGKKRWPERPNIVRVSIGSEEEGENFSEKKEAFTQETVVELVANIDDQSPEELAYAAEQFFEKGALDVTLRSITMKRGRIGTELTVLSTPDLVERLRDLIFAETTTFGVRYRSLKRDILQRSVEKCTLFGDPIRINCGRAGTLQTFSPEYVDCALIARKHKIPIKKVFLLARIAHQKQRNEEMNE